MGQESHRSLLPFLPALHFHHLWHLNYKIKSQISFFHPFPRDLWQLQVTSLLDLKRCKDFSATEKNSQPLKKVRKIPQHYAQCKDRAKQI